MGDGDGAPLPQDGEVDLVVEEAAVAGPVVAAALVAEVLPVTGNKNSEPRWIKKYLKSEDVQKISELVQNIEGKTRAEIVPMIVLRSSAIGHVPLMLTLLLILIFLPLEFYYFQWSFNERTHLWLSLSAVLAFGFSLLLSRCLWIQRVLTANADEAMQVWHRAELEFYRQKISTTQSRAGVLLFVSVMERKAVLLTDELVHKKLSNEVWSPILKEFSADLRKSQWILGFSKALERCGELLSEKFPSESQQARNELANFLRIKE